MLDEFWGMDLMVEVGAGSDGRLDAARNDAQGVRGGVLTNKKARYVNMTLGTWLMLSAFVWRHSEAQFVITLLVGVVVVALTPFALRAPRVRLVNVAAGLALAAAAFWLPPHALAATWHNAVVGVAIAAVALTGPRLRLHRSPARALS